MFPACIQKRALGLGIENARVRGKADQQIPGVGNACGCQQLCRDNAEMHENHGVLVMSQVELNWIVMSSASVSGSAPSRWLASGSPYHASGNGKSPSWWYCVATPDASGPDVPSAGCARTPEGREEAQSAEPVGRVVARHGWRVCGACCGSVF